MHLRFKPGMDPTGTGNDAYLMSICDPVGAVGDAFSIDYIDDGGTIKLRAVAFSAAGYRLANIDGALTVGQWYSILAIFTNSTTFKIYLNATVNINEASTANPTPSGVTDWTIGALTYTNAIFAPTNGAIAECAVWNATLTQAEANMLTKGISPALVLPGNIVSYAPLLSRASPELEIVNGRHLTLVATPTVSDHPPVRYPRRRQIGATSTAAGPATTPGLLGHFDPELRLPGWF